jgi:hypothetical protein
MESKPSLCSLLSQCQAALKSKAVYAPEELVFGLLSFEDPAYHDDEVGECTSKFSKNFSSHYRQMYAMVVKRIGEWWYDKLHQLPNRCLSAMRTGFNFDFVRSLAEYIGHSFEDLYRLFDNVLFMQDIIKACTVAPHSTQAISIEPNQSKFINGSGLQQRTDTDREDTYQIASNLSKLHLTSMSKPRKLLGQVDDDQYGSVGLSRTQEAQGIIDKSKHDDTDESDASGNDNERFTTDIEEEPMWDFSGLDSQGMIGRYAAGCWDEESSDEDYEDDGCM